jgi:hypothetical protein
LKYTVKLWSVSLSLFLSLCVFLFTLCIICWGYECCHC